MNKRTIIALAACLLFFIVWNVLMDRLGWLPSEPAREPQTAEETEDTTPPAEEEPVPQEAPAEKAPERQPPPDAEGKQDVLSAEERPGKGGPERPLTPDRPASTTTGPPGPAAGNRLVRQKLPGHVHRIRAKNTVQLTVDTDAGGVTGVRLQPYLTYDREHHVTLGHPRYPYCTTVLRDEERGSAGASAAEVLETSPTDVKLKRRVAGRPLALIEHWSLEKADSYRLTYNVTLENEGDAPLVVDDLAVTLGGLTREKSANARLSRVGRVDLGAELAVDRDERPESLSADDVAELESDDRAQWRGRSVHWAALHNKYFLFYLSFPGQRFTGTELHVATYVPEDRAGRADEEETEDDDDEQEEDQRLYGALYVPPVTLQPGETTSLAFEGYAGPKEYYRLVAVKEELVSVMRLDLFMFWRADWMGVIAKTILKSLIGIRNFFDHRWGYGFAIIIITFVIKILFWPLTHKSTVSMRRMQKLQPLIQELKKKHKDNTQVMNQKMMELYREHKVNPLGGCLPILFQIPVFFALFNTLRGAIELRQASFLWVADLSQPDTLPWQPLGLPIRPLAILMGGSMLAQHKLSPATADPSQTRMMMSMTLFFMFIFYTMPSGLTLYWTTNQILTIVQNQLIHRMEKDKS